MIEPPPRAMMGGAANFLPIHPARRSTDYTVEDARRAFDDRAPGDRDAGIVEHNVNAA
ncbi:hypothetical protein [Sphingomonas sp.]|uniref:hypothetical protein n=1 Tax=Sphingomonas sp. TaxID=28214 RepID=UPI003AFFC376